MNVFSVPFVFLLTIDVFFCYKVSEQRAFSVHS